MTPTLEQRLWTTLVRMQLLSNGTTAKLDGDFIKGSKQGGFLPAGEHHCEFLSFQVRFARANNYGSKEAIVQEAEQCLREWTHSRVPVGNAKDQNTAFQKMVANQPGSVTEVARLNQISRQSVYEFRRKYRDTEAA